jgi:dihydropteroate synthase
MGPRRAGAEGCVALAVPISVDTCKPEVMRRALDLGVDIVNDIRALRRLGRASMAEHGRCGVCLMHMQGEPRRCRQARVPRRGR